MTGSIATLLLVKMKPEARKNYLDSVGVYKNAFDSETGKLKDNLVADTNRRAISSNLRTISGTLTHKPLSGAETITQGAEKAKKTVERVVGTDATVVVTNELKADEKATFNPHDGVIYINNKADLTDEDVAKAVALHEVTHTTEGTKAYAKLVEQIESVINDKNAPESVKKIVGDIYKRQLSTASAYESEMESLNKVQTKYLVDTEVNADLIGDLLSDENFLDILANRDDGLLKKLYNSFTKRASIKKSELGPDGIKYLKKLASKFGKAIDKRASGVKLSQLGGDDKKETKQSAVVSNERASKTNDEYADLYKKRIDAWDEKTEGFSFVLGDTPEYLSELEVNGRKIGKKQVRIDATKLKKIMHEHPYMTTEVIKELPNLLNQPIIVLDSKTVQGRLVLLGEVYAKETPIMMALEINPTTRSGQSTYVDVIKIASAYARSNTQNLINTSIIRYVDQNKSRVNDWLKVNRLQLPLPNSQSNSADNSIPKNGEKVNSSDERKSKNRLYDPKNDKDFTFEEVPGGIKVNFNDFDTTKSNDNSNDLEVAERARQDSMDALLNSEPPKKEAVIIDNSLLRRITNNTKAKKFTRKDVKNIVDELLSQDGYFGDNFVHLKGKQRAEAERMLWQELNSKNEGELGDVALDIADYIIRNTIATEYLEVTEDVQLAAQFVDAIKPYLHNMNLEAIKGDIKAKFDDNNSPYLMWAVRKNSDFRGYTADEVKQELEALGLGFAFEKTSEADIFFEIDNLYKLAKQVIIDATPSKQTLLTAIGTDEAKKLKQKLAKDIVDAQYTKGTETSFYKLQQKYIDKIAKLGNEVKQAHRRNTLNNRILKEAKKISDSNKHTFANATEAQTDALKNIKSLLSRINSREQINRTSMREIMKELSLWYNQENPVLGYTDEQHPGFFSKQIAELLRYFSDSETATTAIDGDNASYEAIGKMDSVKVVTGQEFAKGEVDLVTQVESYFKKFDSQVTNAELGEIIIDKRGIKDDIAHGIGRKKAATFVAVPEVIQNGKVVDYQKNWKGRNYDTAVIAAPITVGDDRHYMGVVVIQNKENNRFYVHEVVSIKKEGMQPFKTGLVENNSNAGGDTPSVISILQKIANYNSESTNRAKKEKPLSLDELEFVNVILHHMNHIFENYGKIWRGGKYVEAADVVNTHYEVLEDAEKNVPSFERMFLQNKYVRFFMDPMSVLATWDGHDPNGYFTTTYKDLVEGLINQRYDEMQALKELDEFRNDKKNKAYMKALTNGKDKIKIGGRIDPRKGTIEEIEVPKYIAIDLYMELANYEAFQKYIEL